MEPEQAPARRLHPSALLFDAGRRFVSLAFWAIAVLFFAARSEERWYLLFLLPPFVQALIRFASFRYSFGLGELVIREGVLVRSVRHVPYARIQNIDTVQGPIHRLLGVVEVRLETAGGSEPEAVFRVITSAQLAELRARVLGAQAVARSAGEACLRAAPGAEAAFYRMHGRDVLLFGLLSQKGMVLLGGAFVALRQLADWGGLEERLGSELEQVSDSAHDLGPWALSGLVLLAFLALQLGSILWAFVTLYGFRIERKGEDLRTTCGLFTRQTASLPRARVQFLDVRQSWLQRWLGRVSVRALSAGGDSTRESQVARKWLVPLCRRAELSAILAEVQPGAEFDALAWRPAHARAVRRLFLRWLGLLFLPAQASWWHSFELGLAASLAAALLSLYLARTRARALGWALGPGAVFLRDGLFARRLACVRFEKIQSITLRQTPFDRRARMARLSIDTAGAAGSERFVVPYLELRQAKGLLRRLQREAAAVSFRW